MGKCLEEWVHRPKYRSSMFERYVYILQCFTQTNIDLICDSFIFYSTHVYEETTIETTETPKTNKTDAFGEAQDLATTETTLEEEVARSLETNGILETTSNTIEESGKVCLLAL